MEKSQDETEKFYEFTPVLSLKVEEAKTVQQRINRLKERRYALEEFEAQHIGSIFEIHKCEYHILSENIPRTFL